MTEALIQEKKRLVEKLGVHFEHVSQIAPLAARILSFIILTGKKGSTFDDLLVNLGASKSTISTHLNHLQDLKKIKYFTKSGDRKKYFVFNQDAIIQDIDEIITNWENLKDIHIEVKQFKKTVNDEDPNDEKPFNLDFHNDNIKFLEEATKSITILKEKINNQNI
ncbi:GbsR/MarR family transcriptional regulator [Formosa haliotis]|uniref:GbsR/MarR family transcriptional regulator n=1 Tax=Formosa haliotis TaxID=1555194 RepID=UPI000825356A|nr:transcriptional regulator [Formosa haliotis]